MAQEVEVIKHFLGFKAKCFCPSQPQPHSGLVCDACTHAACFGFLLVPYKVTINFPLNGKFGAQRWNLRDFQALAHLFKCLTCNVSVARDHPIPISELDEFKGYHPEWPLAHEVPFTGHAQFEWDAEAAHHLQIANLAQMQALPAVQEEAQAEVQVNQLQALEAFPEGVVEEVEDNEDVDEDVAEDPDFEYEPVDEPESEPVSDLVPLSSIPIAPLNPVIDEFDWRGPGLGPASGLPLSLYPELPASTSAEEIKIMQDLKATAEEVVEAVLAVNEDLDFDPLVRPGPPRGIKLFRFPRDINARLAGMPHTESCSCTGCYRSSK